MKRIDLQKEGWISFVIPKNMSKKEFLEGEIKFLEYCIIVYDAYKCAMKYTRKPKEPLKKRVEELNNLGITYEDIRRIF